MTAALDLCDDDAEILRGVLREYLPKTRGLTSLDRASMAERGGTLTWTSRWSGISRWGST